MKIPSYIIYLFSLFFGFWLTGVLKNIIVLDDRNKLRVNLFVMIIAIVFTFESISSTGPVIGSLIINSLTSQNMIDKITPIILFGVGLVIPVGLILLTLGKMMKKLKEKSWWDIFQFISGIAYIVLAIVGQTIK